MEKKQLKSLLENGTDEQIKTEIETLSDWIEINSATIDELSSVIDLLGLDLEKFNQFNLLLKHGVSEKKARKVLELGTDEFKIARKYQKAHLSLNWNTYCRKKLEESL